MMKFLRNRAAATLAPNEVAVGDRLPYAGHLDEVTLRTRDGLLVQTLHLRGFPFETASDDELNYRKAVRETLLRGVASSRLAIYHHVVRRRVGADFDTAPDNPFCRRLDDAWKARLTRRQLYTNEIFLTLVRRPLQGGAGFFERLLRKPGEDTGQLARELRQLHASRETFLATLAPYGPRTLSLYNGPHGICSEPAEFLSLLTNGSARPVLAPSGDLGQALATRRLSFGYEAMEFGAAAGQAPSYGAMISLKDYPLRSMPGMLDGVLRLPFEMVLTESFAFVEQQTALSRMSQALRRLRAADHDAVSLRGELAAAKDDVAAGRTAYGEHHLSILARTPALEDLDQAVADVQSALAETGAIAVREDMNLEPAFWAQFPGNFALIARKAMISTANFASLASFHNHPTGQASGTHWGGPITVLETTAFGPYHFNFHSGDLGNFTIIGPSGSGKTALLAFLLAQAERMRPRIAYFDKDRGAEGFIRAIGGRYDVISPGRPTGFNPLALPDTGENRAFLAEWIGLLLSAHSAPLDAQDRAAIADAIDANYAQAPNHRRLRYLRELFRGQRRPSAGDLPSRLAAWCDGGEHAWLFDNETDRLDDGARILGFDMTSLLSSPVTRTPAMMYLFHRIEQRLDGTPAIIVVDEGWKALDDEVFVRKIKDWEKTIRKRNGLVGFCTQNADDALESRVGSAIIEQSATQIFFPNPRARASDYVGGFGLSEHEFELVKSLPDTSRCFLVKQADHSVVARLDLSGMTGELRVLAGTETSVRQLDALRARLGDEPQNWLEIFMSGHGRSAGMSGCATVTDLGLVRDVLTAVDCNTRGFARLGYESLTAAGSPFQTALTLLLTVYVAVLGYRLMFGGGARMADAPGMALKIGAVLALVASWSLFQTLVFDMAQRAPVEIASVIAAPMRGGEAMSPVDGLQQAYDRLSLAATHFEHPPANLSDAAQADHAAAARLLRLSSGALFVAGPGLIAVFTVAIGLLTATGPLFIALFLFFETRGFFTGWVRALAAGAFGLLSTWTLSVLMLRATAPWLEALADQPGDARTGMTTAVIVLIFAASQFATALAGVLIARGFRLAAAPKMSRADRPVVQAAHPATLELASRPARLAELLQRPDAPLAWIDRAGVAAAASTPRRRDIAMADPVRLGDLYRRPAVTRTARRE